MSFINKRSIEFRKELKESAEKSENDLSMQTIDEIKETILKRAGVNSKLIKNPVSREDLFEKLECIHPFYFLRKMEDVKRIVRIDEEELKPSDIIKLDDGEYFKKLYGKNIGNKYGKDMGPIHGHIVIDDDWKALYGEQYKDKSVIDLLVSYLHGDYIESSSEYTKWNILQDGTVELTTKYISKLDKIDSCHVTNIDTYSVDGEDVSITQMHNHKQYYKEKTDPSKMWLAEDYTSTDEHLYDNDGIEKKWKHEKIEKISKWHPGKITEHYDSKIGMKKGMEVWTRNITISRDDNDLSKAFVETSYPSKTLVIDLTNSKEDISTLDAAREIVNTNFIDNNLRYNDKENNEVKRERLAKKISESKLPEGCERYGKSQTERTP